MLVTNIIIMLSQSILFEIIKCITQRVGEGLLKMILGAAVPMEFEKNPPHSYI